MKKQKKTKLTATGLQNLKDELVKRQGETKKKLTEDVNEARSAGDLRENEAYSQALDNAASNDIRILKLQSLIANSVIVNSIDDGKVGIGERVTIQTEEGQDKTYEIVGATESDPLNNKITEDTPIGKALVGKRKGDTVKIQLPNGEVEYKITVVEQKADSLK
jgi:transcription elongation factor GreA